MAMEATNQDALSHIQRLPDEVLARLFIVGSWLPGRMSDHHYSNSRDSRHPLQLKPYAKLVSQVCARWHDIVHWRSHGRKLYYAGISLRSYRDTEEDGIAPVLKAYLDSIKNSEDAELYVKWYFSSDREELVPLFLHGMNLTAPHFNRIRSLRVTSSDPTISAFCFSLLNSLGDRTVLTHLEIEGWSPGPPLTVRPEPPLMPTCAPFDTSTIGSTLHPSTPLTALSDLDLQTDSTNIVEKLTIPANLLHLTLGDYFPSTRWNDLWVVLLQCDSLQTLSIIPPSSTSLPELTDKLAISFPCLSELTFLAANVSDMPIILPLLITPRLKYLYFKQLYGRRAEIEGESTGKSDAASRPGSTAMNSTATGSPAHSVCTFTAPSHLHIRLVDKNEITTAVASLFASMFLDAVEVLSIDGQDLAGIPATDANSFQTGYSLIGSPNSLAQTISELFQEHCSKAKARDMPEVRVTASDGKVLYSTLDHAEFMQGYITVGFQVIINTLA